MQDFDGIQRTPTELSDASCYGNLADALLKAGLSRVDVEKIFFGNMERIFRKVTAV